VVDVGFLWLRPKRLFWLSDVKQLPNTIEVNRIRSTTYTGLFPWFPVPRYLLDSKNEVVGLDFPINNYDLRNAIEAFAGVDPMVAAPVLSSTGEVSISLKWGCAEVKTLSKELEDCCFYYLQVSKDSARVLAIGFDFDYELIIKSYGYQICTEFLCPQTRISCHEHVINGCLILDT
jgi:hypothetical protein